jgi:hypothetical protein
MEPLDLRTEPPRAPRAELAGIVFLPRSIDKMRATLPGGNLALYAIPGFTEAMLEHLSISLGDFTEAVRRAATDDDVAAFVLARTKPEDIAAWNAFVGAREPGGGDRAVAIQRYPFLAARPDLILALDVLLEDDRLAYAD